MSQDCAVPDCTRPHFGHGWCNAHYLRWRKHGDPLRGGPIRTPRKWPAGAPERFYREVVLKHTAPSCLVWPYGRIGGGYAALFLDGTMHYVHRLICTRHFGPPVADQVAAHWCGKGHEGCVAPWHLRWKTQAENLEERLNHGTMLRGEQHGNAKLKAVDVRTIRTLQGQVGRAELAAKFDVSRSTILQVQSRKGWTHID